MGANWVTSDDEMHPNDQKKATARPWQFSFWQLRPSSKLSGKIACCGLTTALLPVVNVYEALGLSVLAQEAILRCRLVPYRTGANYARSTSRSRNHQKAMLVLLLLEVWPGKQGANLRSTPALGQRLTGQVTLICHSATPLRFRCVAGL